MEMKNGAREAAKSLSKGDFAKAGLQLGVAVVGSLLTTIVQNKTQRALAAHQARKAAEAEETTVEKPEVQDSTKDSDEK